jgi:hypothetical protein
MRSLLLKRLPCARLFVDNATLQHALSATLLLSLPALVLAATTLGGASGGAWR